MDRRLQTALAKHIATSELNSSIRASKVFVAVGCAVVPSSFPSLLFVLLLSI